MACYNIGIGGELQAGNFYLGKNLSSGSASGEFYEIHYSLDQSCRRSWSTPPLYKRIRIIELKAPGFWQHMNIPFRIVTNPRMRWLRISIKGDRSDQSRQMNPDLISTSRPPPTTHAIAILIARRHRDKYFFLHPTIIPFQQSQVTRSKN